MQVHNCEQNTPEWFAVRLGVPSASNFDKIITLKGDPSKQSEKYLFKLAGEKVSGKQEDGYQNASMLRGIEIESEAKQMYELVKGVMVESVGFCTLDGFGCSPDGLVGDEGLIEIKCPTIAVHVEYLLDGRLPSEYFQQVQGQLLVTGRKWTDFISYYPGLKPLIVRVYPDEKFHKALKAELGTFCSKLNEVIGRIA